MNEAAHHPWPFIICLTMFYMLLLESITIQLVWLRQDHQVDGNSRSLMANIKWGLCILHQFFLDTINGQLWECFYYQPNLFLITLQFPLFYLFLPNKLCSKKSIKLCKDSINYLNLIFTLWSFCFSNFEILDMILKKTIRFF